MVVLYFWKVLNTLSAFIVLPPSAYLKIIKPRKCPRLLASQWCNHTAERSRPEKQGCDFAQQSFKYALRIQVRTHGKRRYRIVCTSKTFTELLVSSVHFTEAIPTSRVLSISTWFNNGGVCCDGRDLSQPSPSNLLASPISLSLSLLYWWFNQ